LYIYDEFRGALRTMQHVSMSCQSKKCNPVIVNSGFGFDLSSACLLARLLASSLAGLLACWLAGLLACSLAKIEPDPGMMQSELEHKEIPTEYVAVMPVKGLRKRRRFWKLAVEHHQKPKERNRGFCGLWKRVTVAGRRTYTTVAWLKRKLFRRSRTQEHCGSWRIFAATSRGMACCAGVSQHGGHDGKS
jgi:hypothetical protein